MTLARHIIAGLRAPVCPLVLSNPRQLFIGDAKQPCKGSLWLNVRRSTSTAKPQSSTDASAEDQALIYSAPNAPTVKLLKMFSVSSLGVIDQPIVFC